MPPSSSALPSDATLRLLPAAAAVLPLFVVERRRRDDDRRSTAMSSICFRRKMRRVSLARAALRFAWPWGFRTIIRASQIPQEWTADFVRVHST